MRPQRRTTEDLLQQISFYRRVMYDQKEIIDRQYKMIKKYLKELNGRKTK